MNFILEFKAIDKAELTSIEITGSELNDEKGDVLNRNRLSLNRNMLSQNFQ